MSNSQTSSHNLRFGLIATAVILACATVVAVSYRPLADTDRGVLYGFALNDYNHHNDGSALRVLRYVQPATVESLNLQTKALIEEGSTSAAVAPAETALRLNPTDPTSILLLGAAKAVSGQAISYSKAPKGFVQLQTQNTAQAQELYALGLLRSSQRVLLAIHLPSSQRSILLANINLALIPGKAGALAATPYAKDAVSLDPTNQAARRLYISVSRKTGNMAAVQQQSMLLTKLTDQRP